MDMLGKVVSWRAALAVACLLIGGVGCDTGGDRRSLTVWHAWSGSEQEAFKGIVARFEAANPGVSVTALPVPFNQLRNKYLTAAAANGGPDLLIGTVDWVGEFHRADVIRPLNGWWTDERRARFLPAAIQALTIGQGVYGVPESLETVALYYNKALMPSAPANLDDLLQRPMPPGVTSLAFRTSFFFTAPWYLGLGGTVFADGSLPDLSGPAGGRFLGWMGELAKRPGVVGKDDYQWMDGLFREGKAAAIINGPWALTDYRQILGDRLGVTVLPAAADDWRPKPFIGIKCVLANQNTPIERQPLVEAFLDVLTDPASALALAQTGHIPVQPLLADALSAEQRVFLSQAETGEPMPNQATMGAVWEPMDKAIAAVLLQGADPQATMRQTAEVIKARAVAVEGK